MDIPDTSYEFELRAEVISLVEWLKNDIDSIESPNTLYDTLTLCKCFVVSICDLISGTYGALEVWSTTAYDVICRSILEAVVDLRVLALSDDLTSNRRFANYHKLTLFWMRNQLISHKEEIPRIEFEYRDYIEREFTLEFDEYSKATNPKAKDIDTYIKWRYHKHWSGKDFVSRAQIARAGFPKSGFLERTDLMWRFLSSSTHPTAYSMIPHFNPSKGTFQMKYAPTVESMRNYEFRLYLYLEAAAEGLYIANTANGEGERYLLGDGPSRYKAFQKVQMSKPAIMKRLFSNDSKD